MQQLPQKAVIIIMLAIAASVLFTVLILAVTGNMDPGRFTASIGEIGFG
jgi:hypothetical protein